MSSNERPKIIVDDDWKTRVQAEKESLLKPGSDEPNAAAVQPSSADDPFADEEMPPASFESLISIFVTQSLAAMGQIPLGDEQQPMLMLDHAKHYIDLLAIIQDKTRGNLTPNEAGMLENLLHELRMVFVSVSKAAK